MAGKEVSAPCRMVHVMGCIRCVTACHHGTFCTIMAGSRHWSCPLEASCPCYVCVPQLATSKEAEETGQLVEVKFMPRTAARKEYTLFVMCDSWIGADRIVPLKLKVRQSCHSSGVPPAPVVDIGYRCHSPDV